MDSANTECKTCEGSGFLWDDLDDLDDFLDQEEQCPDCGGSGVAAH